MTPIPSQGKKTFKLISDQDGRFGLPRADEQVYAPFAVWLDGRLEELVGRWAHLAAPAAGGRQRAMRRG